ncbi:hypothetical protein A2U01_0102946, partial [Trifolium medium]|nr:hypothetical protein [Trifolium medium]
MRFNPGKCTFGVKAGKFLDFYLTERGIEANPDKCRKVNTITKRDAHNFISLRREICPTR